MDQLICSRRLNLSVISLLFPILVGIEIQNGDLERRNFQSVYIDDEELMESRKY